MTFCFRQFRLRGKLAYVNHAKGETISFVVPFMNTLTFAFLFTYNFRNACKAYVIHRGASLSATR